MASISTLVDRVKIFVNSSGTGPFVLGAAVPAFRGAEALADGFTYSYAVENGSNYEAGTGEYVASTNQILRTPTISSQGGAPVAFPAGVQIAFTALAQDLIATGGDVALRGQLATTSGAGMVGISDGSSGALYTDVQTAVDYVRGQIPDLADPGGAAQVGFLQAGTGAVAETVQAALRRIGIYPEQYGALGDNAADDATALSNAVTAAGVSGAPLILTEGKTYLTSAQITLVSGLTIIGNRAAIKAKNGAAITGALLRGLALSSVTIRDLEVDANAANTGADYGIWLTGGSGHLIEDCYVHDTAQGGVLFEELSKSAIRGGRLINCGRANGVGGGAATNNHAVMIFTDTDGSNVSDIDVDGVYIEGAYRKGITTYSGGTGVVSNINIRGNRVLSCGVTPSSGGGIYTGNAPGAAAQVQVNITGNICDGNYVNIEVGNLTYGSVEGNTLTASVAQGLHVNETSHVSVAANDIDNSGTHGMSCTTASGTNKNLTISGNTVMRSNRSASGFGAGIWLNNTVTSTVVGNTVNDDDTKMTHGIIEQGTSDNNVISGNFVGNATSANYTVAGASTTLYVPTTRFHGFGTTAPGNTVDINGGLTIREQAVTLANGANQNVAMPANGGMLVSNAPSGAYNIGGLSEGAAGRRITLVNYTSQVMTLNHQDAGSSAGNRFTLTGSANLAVPAFSTVELVYSALGGGAWFALR